MRKTIKRVPKIKVKHVHVSLKRPVLKIVQIKKPIIKIVKGGGNGKRRMV